MQIQPRTAEVQKYIVKHLSKLRVPLVLAASLLGNGLLGNALLGNAQAQTNITNDIPKILTSQDEYLPDFSYAGYANSERQPDTSKHRIVNVEDHGIHANDGKDDSQALLKLLEQLKQTSDPVIVQFDKGRYIISSIIYFDRSNTVIRGHGAGTSGTEFYFPRPLIYAQPPTELAELREYLVKLDKVQKEKDNNIHLPFTEWSWSGGYFWTRIKDLRVKKYLDKYDTETASLATPTSGKQGEFTVALDNASNVKVGDIIELQWYNKSGDKNDQLIQDLYDNQLERIGSHHWSFDNLPLARQQSEVLAKSGNTITLKTPLLHDISAKHQVNLALWQHLSEIGFEHFSMTFPYAERIAHHVEQGFNGMYLTRLYNGWVDDVTITNADSGIITEEVANLTIDNVTTQGERFGHYSVQMGAVHNVLVSDLRVNNLVEHPLSFNTFATKSVYLRANVKQQPYLDQHSGVNQQNLFDNIDVNVSLNGQREYPLFAGGGAGYWRPQHGAYSTFWHVNINFTDGHGDQSPVLLNGMTEGPHVRLIGVHANLPIKIEYAPTPYIEGNNVFYKKVPSLFDFQLDNRLQQ